MKIEDFLGKLNNFKSNVGVEVTKINIHAARTGLSLMRNRIINDGVNAAGTPLGKYSDKQVPFYFFKNGKLMAPFSSGAISKGAEAKLKQAKGKGKKARPTLSYKDWREFNKLQTNHVDLKFTGDMWRDIDVVKAEDQGEKFVTSITGKNSIKRKGQTTTDIMEHNAKHYGDFMQLSEDEQQQIADGMDIEIQQFLDKMFES